MGYVEIAQGGDLFLDEIENLSLSHQAKLLRFLEGGEYQKVGSQRTQHSQVRVIAATNEPLEEWVAQKKFRKDLLYRLSTHKLILPPLRERKEDIKALCHYFLYQRTGHKKTLDQGGLEILENYSWPGNIRELKKTCEKLCLIAPLPIIRKEDVQSLGLGSMDHSRLADASDLNQGLNALMSNYEKRVFENALKITHEVDTLTRVLKISRSSLYKKIKEHGLELRKG